MGAPLSQEDLHEAQLGGPIMLIWSCSMVFCIT